MQILAVVLITKLKSYSYIKNQVSFEPPLTMSAKKQNEKEAITKIISARGENWSIAYKTPQEAIKITAFLYF